MFDSLPNMSISASSLMSAILAISLIRFSENSHVNVHTDTLNIYTLNYLQRI